MDKFRNKYRIKSARAPWWNYGWNATYFVTICTARRLHHLGKIENNRMVLSEIGKYAEQSWLEIPKHFPFVILDQFIVMPNHVHGIITIDKSQGGVVKTDVETQNLASLRVTVNETAGPSEKSWNRFGPQSRNLGSIIRGFKIGVTKNARSVVAGFAWQSRYHDRIIRDYDEFVRVSHYIKTNPENWKKDRFFKRSPLDLV